MASTFGELTGRILSETNRDFSLTTNVQDAIVSAIKELEQEEYWLFETNAQLTIAANTNSVLLPADFVALSTLRLLVGTTYFSDMNGFIPVTSHEIKQLERTQALAGQPFCYALYADAILVYPFVDASNTYILDMDYFHNDGGYPTEYSDTSVWLDDLTEDLTRYKALSIFYSDSLQSEEYAALYQAKAQQRLNLLRARNNKRQLITRLSI